MSELARAGVLAALFAAAACTPLAAQSASAPSPSPSPGDIPEIGRVVTSDRRLEPLSRATRPTFVVDRSTIEAFGAHTIGDALLGVPGMSLFSYGAFGAQTNYGIRGTRSAETLVLLDGIPIAPASNGQVDLGSLSTLGIGRIEVVESGSSTLYGSSATGGVINLISSGFTKPYGRISTGSYGDRSVAAANTFGGLTLFFERHVANNVYDFPAFASGAAATRAGTRTNADAQQTAVRLSYRGDLGAGWTARLGLGGDAIRIGVPGSLAFGTTPDARQRTSRNDAQLDLTHAAGLHTLTASFAGSLQKLAYADPGPSLGGETDTFDSRIQTSLRYTFSGDRSDLVGGLDLARERALLTFVGFPPFPAPLPLAASQSQTAAYAQFGYQVGAATRLHAGLRAENDRPRGGVIAPSFGAVVDVGHARVSANVAESFRVPTLIDLYYPGFSNPKLVPERLTNQDVTLSVPGNAVDVSAGYFGRSGSNLIVLDTTTFLPFNAARVLVNGLQLVVKTHPFNHVRVTASVTDLYRALDTTTGKRLPSTPPVIGIVGLERPFDGGPFAFGARFRIVGSTPGDGPQPTAYDSYAVADAYVRYRFTPATVVSLRVRNLGNERYMPIYGFPAPGRTVELELATR